MWNQQGKTNKRITLQQQVTVARGANTVLLPFQALRNVGYLSSINLYSSLQAGTVTLGGGTLTNPGQQQLNQLRQLHDMNIFMQGIAPFYQNIRGHDLGFLAYVGNGKHPTHRRREAELGWSSVQTGPVGYPYMFPIAAGDLSAPNGSTGYTPTVQYISATPAYAECYSMEIPISEWLTFPNTQIGQIGNAALVSDAPVECGLLFMQSNTQNVTAFINVAALYGPDGQSTLTVATGNPTITIAAQQWNLENVFYDVPPNPADRPTNFQLRWAITRSAYDESVAGQSMTHNFQNAGYLLRIIYACYNDTTTYNTLVDLGGSVTAPTQLTLESGASVIKIQEQGTQNLRRSLVKYGVPSPNIFVHDLLGNNNEITDALDTKNLVNPRTVITGLPSSVTRVRVIEERAIPLNVVAA